MRRILLLVLTLASSPALAAVPSGCQEDYETCKEDCSIEFGGSRRTLSELTRCISKCQETQDTCAARHSSLKTPAGRARGDSQDDPYAGSDAEPRAVSGKKAPAAAPAAESRSTQAAKPVAAPASPAATRQGVYRASESETAEAAPAPKPAPAPEPEEGLVPMDDVPPPAPKAAAKSASRKESKKEPAKPAPVVEASEDEKDPLLDEEPPPPPPEKKVAPVAAPSRSASPPEPKKKDISEWDPNGD